MTIDNTLTDAEILALIKELRLLEKQHHETFQKIYNIRKKLGLTL